jgi:hypothetical protein
MLIAVYSGEKQSSIRAGMQLPHLGICCAHFSSLTEMVGRAIKFQASRVRWTLRLFGLAAQTNSAAPTEFFIIN